MKGIRKGDEVIVISGRSKGRRGHVLRVLSDDRLVVENVNLVKKHQKPNPIWILVLDGETNSPKLE